MKKLVYVALIAAAANMAGYGQKVVIKRPVASAKVDTQPVKGLVREKFDPTRDPQSDLKKAIETAGSSSKHIILDVGGEWCSWCVFMDKFFYQNAALTKLRDDNYIWVKINYSEENENKEFFAAYPEIVGFPHLFVLDASGKLLRSQDTSALEARKSYDLAKFTAFLKAWLPTKNDGPTMPDKLRTRRHRVRTDVGRP